MTEPTDLLLITHNRLGYVRKSVPRLLESPHDFRVYWWDNASTDGTVDFIESLDDPRLVVKRHASENVCQYEPTIWFLERSRSQVIGKVDDDVLLPTGWCGQLESMVRADSRFGLLGCWIFMPDDWVTRWALRRARKIAGFSVLRNVGVQGQSCVIRKELMKAFLKPDENGFPVDQVKMSAEGFVNGFPVPPLFAHNMDDPRSPHYIPGTPDEARAPTGLTAVRLGFKTGDEYAKWIAADARQRQQRPFFLQLALARIWKKDTHLASMARRVLRNLDPMRRH